MDCVVTKPSTVRPRFLPHHAYAAYNSIVLQWAKVLSRQKLQQTHYYYRMQLNLQNHVNICCCSFNKVSMKRKNSAARNFDLTINFYLMTWDSLMVRA